MKSKATQAQVKKCRKTFPRIKIKFAGCCYVHSIHILHLNYSRENWMSNENLVFASLARLTQILQLISKRHRFQPCFVIACAEMFLLKNSLGLSFLCFNFHLDEHVARFRFEQKFLQGPTLVHRFKKFEWLKYYSGQKLCQSCVGWTRVMLILNISYIKLCKCVWLKVTRTFTWKGKTNIWERSFNKKIMEKREA